MHDEKLNMEVIIHCYDTELREGYKVGYVADDGALMKCPDLPPHFSSRRTSVMV